MATKKLKEIESSSSNAVSSLDDDQLTSTSDIANSVSENMSQVLKNLEIEDASESETKIDANVEGSSLKDVIVGANIAIQGSTFKIYNQPKSPNSEIAGSTLAFPKRNTDSLDSHQKINQQVETIKEMLENEEIKEATTQSRGLISLSSNSIDECDLIIEGVVSIITSFVEHQRHFISLSLVNWIMPMFAKMKSSAEKLSKINECLGAVYYVTFNMYTKGGNKIAIEEKCLPLFEQLLEQIELTQTDETKSKPGVKTRCMNSIGSCYIYIGNYQKAGETLESAIRYMESAVEEDLVKTLDVRVDCYYTCSIVNYLMKNYEKAENLANATLKILNSAQEICYEAPGKIGIKNAQAEALLKKIQSERGASY